MNSEVKLHLYVEQEFQFLKLMLEEEILSVESQPSRLEITGNIASNWWLIQMPNNYTKDSIQRLLTGTPLRYDTMAFAFTIKPGRYLILKTECS